MPKYDFSDFDEKPKYDFSDFDTPVSQTESGLRGAAQGASMGFADELTAALESASGSLGLVPDKTYEQAVSESRNAYKAAEQANPNTYLAGQLAGGIGSAVLAPAAAATIPGRIAQAAGMGAVAGYGMNENRDQALQDIAVGGAAGGLAAGVGEGIGAGIKSAGNWLGNKSEALMEKATGATGKQASQFKPGTGRMLLDSPEISMFSSPKGIAESTGKMLEKAGSSMDEAATLATQKGAMVDENAIVANLENKIAELNRTPEGRSLATQLQSRLDDIYESGRGTITPAESEATKRGLRAGVNYATPGSKEAQKIVSREYQNATEKAIGELGDKELLNQFLKAKSQYGMLSPVNKAAEARALTLNQSPAGGLLDAARATAGGSVGGLPGMIASAIGGKLFAPISSNVAAHSADFVSKLIKAPPAALGKFSSVIQNAAVRGQSAVAVTDWLLEQSNPEYREMKSRLNGN